MVVVIVNDSSSHCDGDSDGGDGGRDDDVKGIDCGCNIDGDSLSVRDGEGVHNYCRGYAIIILLKSVVGGDGSDSHSGDGGDSGNHTNSNCDDDSDSDT